MVASTPTTIPDLIADWNDKLDRGEPADEELQKEARELIGALSGAATAADAEASRLVAEFENAARDPSDDVKPPDDSALESSEHSIATTLDRLFTIFGEDSRARNLGLIREGLPSRGLTHTDQVLKRWIDDYIDPTEAKPLEGTQGRVWDSSTFEAASLAPTEVFGSGANHTALLSYFEMGTVRKGGADTDEFEDYAFVNTSAPHRVRPQFFRSLGARVGAKLRTEGTSKLTDIGDSDLLRRIRAIRYEPSAMGYGSFKPWPESPVSILVHGVLITAGGIQGAMRAFVEGRTVGGVTHEEFHAELHRDSTTRARVADEIRKIQVGQHEWLPVSIFHEVLHHAVEAGLEDQRRALGWITLLETLRTPTAGLLWKIVRDPVIVPGVPKEGQQIAPRGHVAALSLERYKLVQDGLTEGTGHFHDALRTFFWQHRSMDPAVWVDALLAHLPSIMWTGSSVPIPTELRNRPIGVFYAMPSGVFAPDLTVAQVQEEAQRRWDEIVAAFQAAKAGIR
jgi:hypothetical protein